jgi:hypothetical protein
MPAFRGLLAASTAADLKVGARVCEEVEAELDAWLATRAPTQARPLHLYSCMDTTTHRDGSTEQWRTATTPPRT